MILNTINLKFNKGYSSHYSNKINFKGNTPADTASEIIKKGYEPDAIVFKVKVKDLNYFEANYMNLLNKDESIGYAIIENPKFVDFFNQIQPIQHKEWAALHLQKRGFNVTMPKGQNLDDTLDVVLLKSQDAIEQYQILFESKYYKKKFDKQAKKCSKAAYRDFYREVGNPYKDIHYKDAADYLKLSVINELGAYHFNNLLDTLKIRKFNYKPAELTSPRAQAIHLLNKTFQTLA